MAEKAWKTGSKVPTEATCNSEWELLAASFVHKFENISCFGFWRPESLHTHFQQASASSPELTINEFYSINQQVE